MTPKDDVPISYLRQIFEYDAERGLLIHKERPHVRAGIAAGHVKLDGYIHVKIHQRAYYVHRIIWALVTGAWPKDQIDHVNLVKSDNRWTNLREATHSQNKANIRTLKANGLKGVRHATKNRWRANCGGNDLGYFLTEEAAHAAYAGAARRMYGEFARHA